jgi:broad specificity phosphatase PhoE
MLLFYVRHGDPIYDPDMLTPLGERQAESVARRMALFGIDEVYSSTSDRAMQTARPLCEILKKELKTLDFLNEKYATGTEINETDWFAR